MARIGPVFYQLGRNERFSLNLEGQNVLRRPKNAEKYSNRGWEGVRLQEKVDGKTAMRWSLLCTDWGVRNSWRAEMKGK